MAPSLTGRRRTIASHFTRLFGTGRDDGYSLECDPSLVHWTTRRPEALRILESPVDILIARADIALAVGRQIDRGVIDVGGVRAIAHDVQHPSVANPLDLCDAFVLIRP